MDLARLTKKLEVLFPEKLRVFLRQKIEQDRAENKYRILYGTGSGLVYQHFDLCRSIKGYMKNIFNGNDPENLFLHSCDKQLKNLKDLSERIENVDKEAGERSHSEYRILFNGFIKLKDFLPKEGFQTAQTLVLYAR